MQPRERTAARRQRWRHGLRRRAPAPRHPRRRRGGGTSDDQAAEASWPGGYRRVGNEISVFTQLLSTAGEPFTHRLPAVSYLGDISPAIAAKMSPKAGLEQTLA